MHIFLDETGNAEKEKFFGIGGVIVKDLSQKDEDIRFLKNLCKKYNINFNTIHSCEIKDNTFHKDFLDYVSTNDNLTPFFFGNWEKPDEDKGGKIFGKVYFVGDRYIEMMINVVEYLLFIDRNLGKNIRGFHFATRVRKIENEDEINQYINLGYNFNEQESIVYLWDRQRASTLISTLCYKYRVPAKNLEIEIIDSKPTKEQKSEDQIYYKIADICVNIMYKKSIRKQAFKISDIYNPLIIYKFSDFEILSKTITAFYSNDYIEFFSNIAKIDKKFLENKNNKKIINEYIDEVLSKIKKFKDLKTYGILNFFNKILDEKKGNYTFVTKIGKYLIDKFNDELPFEFAEALQRAYNHVGDYSISDRMYQIMINYLNSKKSFEGILKKAEIINRHAITLTNIFKFEDAKREIEKILPEMEKIKSFYKNLKFELLGKIYGSYGQILALMGDDRPEEYFLKAINEFNTQRDINIQYSYLCHYYLERKDFGNFYNYFNKIIESYKDFQCRDDYTAAKFKKFVEFSIKNKIDLYHFELILKWIYLTKSFKEELLNNLNIVYNNYKDEKDHPVEKIMGYLFLIAEGHEEIEKYLKHWPLFNITIIFIKLYFLLKSNLKNDEKHKLLKKFISKIENKRKDYFKQIFIYGTFKDVYKNMDIDSFVKKFKFYFA